MGSAISNLHVRRSIWIKASRARVWEEFSSLERFTAWFGRGHKIHSFDLELGGTADLSVEIGGADRHFGGAVVVLEPLRELTFESNWHPPYAWSVPTLITLRLVPLYGGTLVELFHHGFDRLGPAAGEELSGYEAGWDLRHLRALREIVSA